LRASEMVTESTRIGLDQGIGHLAPMNPQKNEWFHPLGG
jgi:hypothetical protein